MVVAEHIILLLLFVGVTMSLCTVLNGSRSSFNAPVHAGVSPGLNCPLEDTLNIYHMNFSWGEVKILYCTL